jgi:hypothetical protein
MSRPRGTGRIYNQKQSSILWIQYYRDGKMHRESTGTADKRKATRILSRRLAEISTGSFTAPDVARIGISELAEDFLRDYRINGRTSIDDAEARWRLHIEPFFGSLRVSAVTSDLLDRYVDRRQQQGAQERNDQPRACGAETDATWAMMLHHLNSSTFRGSRVLPKTIFAKDF